MKDLIDKLLQNGLRDFEGATISGSIPIREEAINEVVMEFLRDFSNPGTPATSPSNAPASPQNAASQLPIKQLARHVTSVNVKAEHGKVTLQFQIEVR